MQQACHHQRPAMLSYRGEYFAVSVLCHCGRCIDKAKSFDTGNRMMAGRRVQNIWQLGYVVWEVYFLPSWWGMENVIGTPPSSGESRSGLEENSERWLKDTLARKNREETVK